MRIDIRITYAEIVSFSTLNRQRELNKNMKENVKIRFESIVTTEKLFERLPIKIGTENSDAVTDENSYFLYFMLMSSSLCHSTPIIVSFLCELFSVVSNIFLKNIRFIIIAIL